MPGKLAQLNGMLAGHQRRIAPIVGSGVCHIAGGVNRRMGRYLQIVIHLQATLAVAFAVNVLTQRMRGYACGPDHG
ncbi:hypothetical protein D3C75_953560 [compost metagenome]